MRVASVPISSVFQLEEPPEGELFLYHHRFEQKADGLTLPLLVEQILDMGVEPDKFKELLGDVGYREELAEEYRDRGFRMVERRMYAVAGDGFPRIIPASFDGGVVPAGTTRITYSIDLTNEPPSPIDTRRHRERRPQDDRVVAVLQWIPEEFPKSGGLSAAGFAKLLGRPQLDPLAVLLRETAQNSWDARQNEKLPVGFTIEGWDLEPSEVEGLRDAVFLEAGRARGTGLNEALGSDALRAFYIYDRNTIGLGGPLQAGDESPSDVYDWADFVLNIGKANLATGTGGTYGFGKTIAYIASFGSDRRHLFEDRRQGPPPVTPDRVCDRGRVHPATTALHRKTLVGCRPERRAGSCDRSER